MATPLLARKRVLAFELEATYGTLATLTATDAGFRCFERNMRIVSDTLRRERQGLLGSSKGVAEAKHAELSLTTHIHGHTAVPKWSQLFQACGMSVSSLTYTADSDQSTWKGLSAGHYVDGRKKLGRGMMGNWVARLTAGRVGSIDWTFLGGYSADPIADTLLTGMSYETAAARPPIFDGSGSITIDGSTDIKIANMTIDFGNEVALREDPNSEGGYIGAWIGNRMPTVTIDPEALAYGTKNWYAIHSADTEITISAVLNGGANNTVTFTLTGCQLASAPDDNEERGGRLVDALTFNINDDGIAVVFS